VRRADGDTDADSYRDGDPDSDLLADRDSNGYGDYRCAGTGGVGR
jgi:hypothetical protein